MRFHKQFAGWNELAEPIQNEHTCAEIDANVKLRKLVSLVSRATW